MKCGACENECSADARFCEQCGSSLPRRCAACGATLAAKARFCPACGASAEGSVSAEAPSPASGRSSGERRPLTVVFCDLVGFTQLGQRLDPEDLREVLRADQDACQLGIKRCEGHIAQYLGDGILAYFGYPQAHEDDADRAGRAALEIQASAA